MRALNILHVFRAPIGGLFRHVVDLVQAQIARGHHVGIVADSMTGNARTRDMLKNLAPVLALGLSLTPIHRPFGPGDIAAAWHVVKRVRRTEPDVIHGHGAKGGAFARLALARKSAIRAYTPHGGSLLLDHRSLSGKAHLALERILMPFGDLYLFESAFSARVFNDRVGHPSGLERVVHNGVTPAELAPVPLAPDATDLVFLGEFRTVKGVDVLIDAIGRLHRNGMPVTATLVGDGVETAALAMQALRLGLDRAIRFAPPMAARDAMAFGRVMVIPSRAELLPYVVLEAAAAGKPLLTTNVGGIPEIYGPLSGTLLAAGDAEVLAGAIANVINSPVAMKGITQMLRARIAGSFTTDAMVDQVLAGYERAIDTARSGKRSHFVPA